MRETGLEKFIPEGTQEQISAGKKELKKWKKIDLAVRVVASIKESGLPEDDVKYIQNAIVWNDGKIELTWDRQKLRNEVEKRKMEEARKKIMTFAAIGMIFRELSGMNND